MYSKFAKVLKITPNRKESTCKFCGDTFVCPKSNPGIYCSRRCKSEWQRTQKPVDREWLHQKYVVEQLDCSQIAKIVNRDPKSVWNWLKDFGIPTRPRGSYWYDHSHFAFWLHGKDSPFKGRTHTEETKAKQRAIAIADGRVPFDPAVGPPYRGKRGPETSNWKGGVTKERQAFYSTIEWKAVAKAVWIRDRCACQRCGKKRGKGDYGKFDIHHIISFEYVALRADIDNLVLLCERCHYFVHSKENVNREFIRDTPVAY